MELLNNAEEFAVAFTSKRGGVGMLVCRSREEAEKELALTLKDGYGPAVLVSRQWKPVE